MEKHLGPDPDRTHEHHRIHRQLQRVRPARTWDQNAIQVFKDAYPRPSWGCTAVVALGALALGYLWMYGSIMSHKELWRDRLTEMVREEEWRDGR